MRNSQIAFGFMVAYLFIAAILQFYSVWFDDLPNYFIFLLTETATFPYVLLTLSAFLLIFAIFVDKKNWKRLFILFFCSMLLTQASKSALKNIFAKPRPFVSVINDDKFYKIPREERAQLVENYYKNKEIAPFLKEHRMHETGYSFPSGHTIFAVSISFLSLWIIGLGTGKRFLLVTIISGWTILMMYSRVRLGMHDGFDLMAAIFLAWIIHQILFKFYPLIEKSG